jgi:hypothetical protein
MSEISSCNAATLRASQHEEPLLESSYLARFWLIASLDSSRAVQVRSVPVCCSLGVTGHILDTPFVV